LYTSHRNIFDLPLLGHLLAKPERVKHGDSKIVPFSPQQLFDVVSDVDRYREFLPFCVDSRVTRRIDPRTIETDLTIGFRIFTETYTSRVDLVPGKSVNVRCIRSNVFSYLVSHWSFTPVDAANTKIEFSVEFEVISPVHAQAVHIFFGQVAQKQMKAFEQRCYTLFSPLRKLVDTTKTAQRLQQQQQQQPIAVTSSTPAQTKTKPVNSAPVTPVAAPQQPLTHRASPATTAAQPAVSNTHSKPSHPTESDRSSHVLEHGHHGSFTRTVMPPASEAHDDWFTASELKTIQRVYTRHADYADDRLGLVGFRDVCAEIQKKDVMLHRYRDR